VKTLIFEDVAANRGLYALRCPDALERWNVAALRDFLAHPATGAQAEGYLAEPVDALRHESFRRLINDPASTLNAPIRFAQGGVLLKDSDAIRLDKACTRVSLRRESSEGDVGAAASSLGERHREAYQLHRAAFHEHFDALFDFERNSIETIEGLRVRSFEQLADDFATRLSPPQQLRFLHHCAALVQQAPFENISRILHSVRYRSGLEMWDNMARGFGGICAEKNVAFKFVCDVLGLPSVPVLGARDDFPDDFEARTAAFLRGDGETSIPVQVSHFMLEVAVAGDRYLVDATGGNIPLLFLNTHDAAPYLSAGYRSRMFSKVERLALRRTAPEIGDGLLMLCEYHLPDLHYGFIFEQGLGLAILSNLYIGACFDWGGERSAILHTHHATVARRQRLPYPLLLNDQTDALLPCDALLDLLREVRHRLKHDVADPHYSGDVEIVLQPLQDNFWRRPRLSAEVWGALGPRPTTGSAVEARS